MGQQVAEGDLNRDAKVIFPMAPTEKMLAFNNAMLLTTAIVTTFLAMWRSSPSPLRDRQAGHAPKEVSDAISRGNLDRPRRTSAQATNSKSSARLTTACCGIWWPFRKNCGR